MRRTALRIFWLTILAAFASTGCGPDGQSQTPGGTGGSGGIGLITGGTGGGTGGTGGGTGGAGGEGGNEGPGFELEGVYPRRGTMDGGTRVTITGSGFVTSVSDEAPGASTVVYFGGNPSLDTRVVDDRTLQATTPVGLEGEVDVVVKNSSGERVCEGCFRYLPPLRLDAIEPNSGPVEGGSRITLRGEGFDESTIVLIGGRAALLPEVGEDGSLSVILPPGDGPGLVDVRAVSAARQSLLRRAFRYQTELRIEEIDPPVSPQAGGEIAIVRGTGFSSSTRILFGGVETTARLVDGGLEVTIPRGSAVGAVTVEARDGDDVATFPFAYVDPNDGALALFAVAPDWAPVGGGAEIAVLGSGFDPDTLVVYFGETPSTDVRWESANVARAVVPPGAEGAVDVRVRTAEGMDTLPSAFRYVRTMAIHGVEPASGPTAGGTPIAITGAGFPEGPVVYVGALAATGVVRIDEGRIEALTPPGTDGSVPVRVVDADAPAHRAVLQDAFTYEGELTLAVVDPPTGARAGGTRVFVRGTGFRGEMQVYFGDAKADAVTVVDPFTLEVLTPRGNVGLVDVRVERDDGAKAELEGAFSYFNPSSGYGGSSGGPLNGVLNVTVLATSGPNENGPIEGCTVYVGSDETSRLTKTTDDRGQATFSSPSLVKAVSLTVHCENYEIATVANQVSENVTVLLGYNGPQDGEPSDPPEQPPPGVVGGRVYGFKRPQSRTLAPNEEEVALVSIAYPNIYRAPPFGQEIGFIELFEEGGQYAFQFRGPGYFTVYAIYGIRNVDTEAFEPLLFGYTRGISVPQSETYMEADVVLDTRLERDIPVTIQNPPWNAANSVEVTAFLDLGADGVIPLAKAVNETDPEKALLVNMPPISGESLIFLAWGETAGTVPWTFSYRRQGGDLSEGVTVGPLMGPVTITEPPLFPGGGVMVGFFEGTFEWEIEPSAQEPDVIYISVYQPPSLFSPDPIPEWHVVLPGDERRVTMPESVRQALSLKFGGQTVLAVDFITGSQPTFDFPGWNYAGISLGNFTSFTFHRIGIVP